MTGIISQEEFNFRIDRFLNTHYMGIDNNAIFYGYVNTTPNIYDYYNTMFKDLLKSLFYMSKNLKYNKYTTILEVVRYIKTDTGHGLRDCKHFYDYISVFIDIYMIIMITIN